MVVWIVATEGGTGSGAGGGGGGGGGGSGNSRDADNSGWECLELGEFWYDVVEDSIMDESSTSRRTLARY